MLIAGLRRVLSPPDLHTIYPYIPIYPEQVFVEREVWEAAARSPRYSAQQGKM